MTRLEELTKCIKKLSADAVNTLLDAVKILLASESTAGIPDCPYCGSTEAIRYGHKCGKQRFLCKQCGRTFATTTQGQKSHPVQIRRQAEYFLFPGVPVMQGAPYGAYQSFNDWC